MRNTREILRQKWLLERPHRAVVASVGVSVGAVSLALAARCRGGADVGGRAGDRRRRAGGGGCTRAWRRRRRARSRTARGSTASGTGPA